jgi:hypothetical protein
LHRVVRLVAQQAIRIVAAFQFFAVDRQHVVADVDVDAYFLQRRAIEIFFILALKDFRNR